MGSDGLEILASKSIPLSQSQMLQLLLQYQEKNPDLYSVLQTVIRSC